MPRKIDWIEKAVSEGDDKWLLVGTLRNGFRVEMRGQVFPKKEVDWETFTVESETGGHVVYNMADIYRGHTLILRTAKGCVPPEKEGPT